MRNLFRQFMELIPDPALQVGAVTDITNGIVTVLLPGGGVLTARGVATIGQNVFVRNGLVEAVAPALPVEIIEI